MSNTIKTLKKYWFVPQVQTTLNTICVFFCKDIINFTIFFTIVEVISVQ